MNRFAADRLLLVLWLLTLPWLPPRAAAQESPRNSSVGMPVRIEQLVLPGTRLEAKPLDDRQLPIVLRVIDVYPHGSDFRYDLEYYGLEAGSFDLRDYLQREDGTDAADLPPLPVTIQSVLPPGHVLPNAPDRQQNPSLGGYRLLMIIAGTVWIVGLLALLVVGRHRRRQEAATRRKRALTLAERLEPMVRAAMAGQLPGEQRAELERLLLAFWRGRLGLQRCKAAEAMTRLREHPEAGRLLRQLEAWLHRPVPATDVDINELLAPYGRLAPQAVAGSP